LSLLAAHFCQQIGGAAVFNAFSDNRQAEQRAQTDGGADDGSIVDFDPQLTHKRLVDFQSADRELLQVGQTCIASSEIVEQDTDAEVPYLAKNFDGILIVDEDVLGDFDLETVLSLASAGAGIRFFLADQWQAGFGFAVPVHQGTTANDVNSVRAIFSLSKSFQLYVRRKRR
jgi:hypothetical protein